MYIAKIIIIVHTTIQNIGTIDTLTWDNIDFIQINKIIDCNVLALNIDKLSQFVPKLLKNIQKQLYRHIT